EIRLVDARLAREPVLRRHDELQRLLAQSRVRELPGGDRQRREDEVVTAVQEPLLEHRRRILPDVELHVAVLAVQGREEVRQKVRPYGARDAEPVRSPGAVRQRMRAVEEAFQLLEHAT